MSDGLTFKQSSKAHLKTLAQYVPVVDRVHGDHHPEFHIVREIYEEISRIIQEAEAQKPALYNEFAKLREITKNYTVPDDVCESYEAVYNMLSELDKAYFQ